MQDNPYQAPAAQPASLTRSPRHPRPWQVDLAVTLLWVSAFVGGLSYLADIVGLRESWPNTIEVSITAAVLAFLAVFVWLIGSGRNWARVLFLILFILGLPGWLLMLPSIFGRSIVLGSLSVLQTSLQGIAMWFLFTNPGLRWYRGRTAIEHLRNRPWEGDPVLPSPPAPKSGAPIGSQAGERADEPT